MTALWLAFKASRAFRPVIIGGGVLLLLALIFALGRCTGHKNDAQVTAQVEQTDRSAQAIANAAQDAIATIGNRTASDATVDKAVSQATREIGNAESADAVHDVVVASLCGEPSHRRDPACQVRQPDP